jgi:hypothetical protein
MAHRDGIQGWYRDGAHDATGEAGGGMTVKGGKVLAPPPISIVPRTMACPPPFFHPEQLELVFELQSQMADQIHHDILMHQRIDMLYEAFSNAPAGQKCLTCARPFVLQTQNGLTTEIPTTQHLMLTGNSMEWSSIWFWCTISCLDVSFNSGPMSSSNSSLVLLPVSLLNNDVKTTGCHLP